jgi:hypothetical protein
LKKVIVASLKDLLKDEAPWWALDEVHVLAEEAKGFVLHSDYQSYHEEKLFQWHQFEVSPKTKPKNDYPYKVATSLYSCFRYLAEEMIKDNKQMTFFASTYFSSWVPLLDTTKYSRQKVEIIHKSDLPILKLDEDKLSKLLKEVTSTNIPYEDWIQEDIEVWNGRPGFLYCFLLGAIIRNPPASKSEFKSIWTASYNEALNSIANYIDNPLLNASVSFFNI